METRAGPESTNGSPEMGPWVPDASSAKWPPSMAVIAESGVRAWGSTSGAQALTRAAVLAG